MKILYAPAPAVTAPPGGGGATSIPSSGATPVTPAAPPAPSTPAAPAKPSAPATPAKSPSPFEELDTLMPDAKAPAEPKKPVEPAAKPAEPAKPVVPPERQMQGPKELRDYAKRLEGEKTTLSARVQELEKKITETDKAGESSKALTERLATVEKQLAEKEAQIYANDAQQSPEFKAKYDKPFDRAADFAKRQIEGMDISETGEDGETVSTRPATFEDFVALYKMPFNKAVKAANALFGDSAPVVINHISELQRLDYQRQEALHEARETAATRRKDEETTKIANESKQKEQVTTLWTSINKDLENRNPEFQADPSDPKESELLKKSFALIDSSYGPRKELTLEQSVLLDVEIRHRAAREPLLKYRMKKLQAQVTELTAVIAELRGSPPGDTNNPGNQPAEVKAKGLFDELDSLEA